MLLLQQMAAPLVPITRQQQMLQAVATGCNNELDKYGRPYGAQDLSDTCHTTMHPSTTARPRGPKPPPMTAAQGTAAKGTPGHASASWVGHGFAAHTPAPLPASKTYREMHVP